MRVDPLPPEMADMLDLDRITQVVGDWLCEDDFLRDELEAGRLSWVRGAFDAEGRAPVEVWHCRTGQVIASATVHWSALLR